MIVGIYGGLAGLAVAMGPIVGGAVTQSIDWHWIFWINVPIGVTAVLLGVRLLAESYGAPERLDLVGVGLVTAGVVALVWALSRANEVGWSSAEVVGPLIAAAVLLVVFLRWENSVREPLVPLRLFAVRDFAVGNLATFLMSGAIFAGGLLVTEEFQLARHYSPVGAGVRLLPFFATPMFISPLAGALSDRIGRRPIIVVGLSMLTAGFAWVAWQGSLRTSSIELVVALLIAGIGISMALPTVPTAVLSAVAPHEMGKASGINYMAQRFGAVFAVAIGSTLFATYGGLGEPGDRDGRIQAGALGVLRLGRPGRARCHRDVGGAETSRRARAGGPAERRLKPTTQETTDRKGDAQCGTSCTVSRSTRRPSACTNSRQPRSNLRSCQTLLPAFVAE